MCVLRLLKANAVFRRNLPAMACPKYEKVRRYLTMMMMTSAGFMAITM